MNAYSQQQRERTHSVAPQPQQIFIEQAFSYVFPVLLFRNDAHTDAGERDTHHSKVRHADRRSGKHLLGQTHTSGYLHF